MKKMIIILLFVFSIPVYAGFDMSHEFKYYELSKNLCFVSVADVKKNNEIDDRVIRNIAIINLKSNEITYLFNSEFKENVLELYFENVFLMDQKRIKFNTRNSEDDSFYVKNNRDIETRPTKDKLCILTFNPNTKKYSLWFSSKLGQGIKRVKTFNNRTEWWIDVRNSKVYFVRQIKDKIQCESIEW